MARKALQLFGIAAVVVFLDQWTKLLIVQTLTLRLDGLPSLRERLKELYSQSPLLVTGLHYAPKHTVTLSERFLRFRYAENPGAAWGLFRDVPEHVRAPLFHVVSIGAVVVLTYYFFRTSRRYPNDRWALLGLPLVLGGAVGNYIDRLARGFVVDFIEAHWYERAAWPSFNVADMAICVGVAMLFFGAGGHPRKQPDVDVPRSSQA